MIVWGVTGWKNSGKTHLAERLVAEFKTRDMRVATVKHAHQGFDLDRSGTDSDRHRQAGASEVLVASPNRWALMHEGDGSVPLLSDLLGKLSPSDIVLVEGFKREPHPKIECVFGKSNGPLVAEEYPSVRALAVKEWSGSTGLPVFDLDDATAIADFILTEASDEAV